MPLSLLGGSFVGFSPRKALLNFLRGDFFEKGLSCFLLFACFFERLLDPCFCFGSVSESASP